MTHQEIKDAIKAAMKNKEATKLSVLRGLSAAMTNELVAKGRGPDGQLTEDEVLTLIIRASKQRKDSIEQFEKGGRPELAAGEKEELAILETMLPPQMSETEIETAAKAKAAQMGITDLSAQAGKTGANQLMGALMKDLKGKADGTVVKAIVERLFV
jgi:uncharacterized protein YqeY